MKYPIDVYRVPDMKVRKTRVDAVIRLTHSRPYNLTVDSNVLVEVLGRLDGVVAVAKALYRNPAEGRMVGAILSQLNAQVVQDDPEMPVRLYKIDPPERRLLCTVNVNGSVDFEFLPDTEGYNPMRVLPERAEVRE